MFLPACHGGQATGENARIRAVPRLMYTCVAVLLFAAVSLPAQTASGGPSAKPKPTTRGRAAKAAPKVQETPPTPTAIVSMTPEQLPAVAPRVSFQNGRLTVDAENSTLGAVLNAIRRQTGAQIDVPPTGANQRVAAHLSGTPREVIASLLDGSELGYAILAAPDNPERVQQVILMTQSRNSDQFPASGNSAPGMSSAPSPGQPPVDADPDLAPADEGPTPEQMNERFPQQSNQQEPPPGQPPANGMSQNGMPQNGMPSNPPQSPDQQQTQSNGTQNKTPEQLLQELQRMRNRRYSAPQ